MGFDNIDSTGQSAADFGNVIFECRFRRLFAVLIILVAGVFAWILADVLFFNVVLGPKRGIVYTTLFGLMLFVAVLVLWLGVNLLRRPTVFFQVTERGIVNNLGPLGRLEEPAFIPWSRVESIELVRLMVRHAGSRRGWSYFIALGVAADDDWPPDDFPGYEAAKKVVHLDAFSGTPSRDALLEQIRDVYERYRAGDAATA